MENQIDSVNQKNDSEEISLLDLFGVLLRYKFLIIGITMLGAIASVVISIISIVMPPEKSFLPNQYSPRAVMLITESGSGSSMPSGLSSLASFAGVNIGGGGSSNSSLAQYLAKSNLLYDALNDEFHFTEKFEIEKSPVANTRKALSEKLTSSYDEDSGIFKISFTDIDPIFAQQVVNFAIDWLMDKFNELGIDKNNIQKTNLEKNIDSTYREILRLEQQTQDLGSSLNSGAGVWNIPNANLETSRLKMELDAQKSVYTQLKTQYEVLKVQMQSEQPVFQIIERPEVPDLKSKPSRGKLCIIITFAAGFLSVFLAFLLNAIKNIKNDPEAIRKLTGK